MDNVTHTLVGVVLGQAGLERRFGRGTTVTLAVASNLPDVDALSLFSGVPDAFLWRRGLTHSVVGIPVLSAVAASLFARIFPGMGWRRAFALSVFAMALHVVFDYLNSYGVRPLEPFDGCRHEAAWLFIVDLALLAVLAAPLVLRRWIASAERRERCALSGVVGAAVYVFGCGAAHARAEQVLDAHARTMIPAPSFAYVFPEALGPHRFRGVTRQDDLWTLFRIDVVPGRVEAARRYRSIATADPELVRVRALPAVRRLEAFYKAPVWRPLRGDPNGNWLVFDLRFVSTVLPPRLTHAFVVDAMGRISGSLIPSRDASDLEVDH